MVAAEEETARLSPDGPRDMPYTKRENRMVTEHHWGPAKIGHHKTVMMKDQDIRMKRQVNAMVKS